MDQLNVLRRVSDWQLAADSARTVVMVRIGSAGSRQLGEYPPAHLYQLTADQARELATRLQQVLG